MADPKLMSYLRFDDADLQANRNGQFTDKQTARIVKENKSGGILDNLGGLIFIFVALIGLGVAAPFVWGALSSSNPAAGLGVGLGIGLPFGCIWPLVWGGLGVRSFMYSSSTSKHQFTLHKLQDYASITSRQPAGTEGHPESAIFTLHIGGKAFSVDRGLSELINNGAVYAVYYYIVDDLSALLSTKNILSAELISRPG